jgi:hypothetical protein
MANSEAHIRLRPRGLKPLDARQQPLAAKAGLTITVRTPFAAPGGRAYLITGYPVRPPDGLERCDP